MSTDTTQGQDTTRLAENEIRPTELMDEQAKRFARDVARLYGIDMDEKLKTIKNDEFSQRRAAYLASAPATDTGVARAVPA